MHSMTNSNRSIFVKHHLHWTPLLILIALRRLNKGIQSATEMLPLRRGQGFAPVPLSDMCLAEALVLIFRALLLFFIVGQFFLELTADVSALSGEYTATRRLFCSQRTGVYSTLRVSATSRYKLTFHIILLLANFLSTLCSRLSWLLPGLSRHSYTLAQSMPKIKDYFDRFTAALGVNFEFFSLCNAMNIFIHHEWQEK